jgi:hypothetical protein
MESRSQGRKDDPRTLTIMEDTNNNFLTSIMLILRPFAIFDHYTLRQAETIKDGRDEDKEEGREQWQRRPGIK